MQILAINIEVRFLIKRRRQIETELYTFKSSSDSFELHLFDYITFDSLQQNLSQLHPVVNLARNPQKIKGGFYNQLRKPFIDNLLLCDIAPR